MELGEENLWRPEHGIIISNIRNGKEQYIHTLNGTKWYQQFHDKFTEQNWISSRFLNQKATISK